jgi:hypothetical protein
MTHWQFVDDFVRTIYKSCVEACVDYMEIATKAVKKPIQEGKRTLEILR